MAWPGDRLHEWLALDPPPSVALYRLWLEPSCPAYCVCVAGLDVQKFVGRRSFTCRVCGYRESQQAGTRPGACPVCAERSEHAGQLRSAGRLVPERGGVMIRERAVRWLTAQQVRALAEALAADPAERGPVERGPEKGPAEFGPVCKQGPTGHGPTRHGPRRLPRSRQQLLARFVRIQRLASWRAAAGPSALVEAAVSDAAALGPPATTAAHSAAIPVGLPSTASSAATVAEAGAAAGDESPAEAAVREARQRRLAQLADRLSRPSLSPGERRRLLRELDALQAP